MPARVAAELAGWQEMARAWPLTFTLEDGHLRCEPCGQSVIRLTDDGGQAYFYEADTALTLAVAHIRQVHGDKPPA
jgi:hypothetical protein